MSINYFLLNTTPEKRYKNFISTVADREEIWMLSNNHGFTSFDDDFINLLVWPLKEYAEMYQKDDSPISIEIHDFCDRLNNISHSDDVRFMVFPNNVDAFVVEPAKLLCDITSELNKIE